MNIYKLLLLLVSVVLVSAFFTNLIRHLSIKYKFYDIPNDRSSHDARIPKGGGIPIIVIVFLSIAILLFLEKIDFYISISLLLGIIIISATSLIDDFKSLSVTFRAIAYTFGAALSFYLIDGLATITIGNNDFNLKYFSYPLCVLFIFWMTNLYNFMDGTDGFAAVQTICVSLFCGILAYISSEISYAIILLCIAASTIGFLFWNWSPAKIFMGDVGSCSLGFVFGLLSIHTEKNGLISISIWLILLAPFIVDTSLTLIKRIITGEKWYKAHNTHAYQRFYQSGFSHGQLAIALLKINLLIIWPCAYIANIYKNLELAMLILVYCFMGSIWLIGQKNLISKTKSFENN